MSTRVEFGMIQKLLITEVTQRGRTVFVQLDTPEAYQVQDLSREIETHVSEQNRDQLNFEPGSRCYARASDGVLYRALVVTKTTPTTATVYFTDYGNSEEVEISNVFPPTGSYFDLPAQALCCTLSDFVPTLSKWTETIQDILVEKLVNQEVHGIFRSLSSHPHPHSDAVLQDAGQYPSYNVTLFQDEVGAVSYSDMLVGAGLGQYSVCNENVSVGTTARVFVAFSDSPGRFWLQLSTSIPTLEVIAATLGDEGVMSSLQPLPREGVFPGVACCVVFVDDGLLYRVNVIEIKGSKVEVQFVDYGNSTAVSTGDLLRLPPSLSTIPAQAIQCCLEGVRPVKKDWSTESCDAFANGTVNVEMDAVFVDELTPEVFTVVLRNPETGTTISEMLVASGCAQSSDPTSILGNPPSKKFVKSPIQQSLPKEYTAGKMEVGQSYEVAVTHLESPSVVWAQVAAHEAVFRDMMNKMSALFKGVASIPGLEEAVLGQPCAAQFSDDGRWYRGKIEAIDRSSKRAQVLFVDFGNSAVFKIAALKKLQPELILLPTQAVSFSLHALVPADGGSVWPAKTMSSFMKMTSCGVFSCQVVELDGDGYPAVRLRDRQGRDIGEELVKMGLAAWKGGERKSRDHQQTRPPRDASSQSESRGGGRRHSGGYREGSGSRERHPSQGGGSRERHPSQGGGSRERHPSQGGGSRERHPSQGGGSRERHPSQGGGSRERHPSQGDGLRERHPSQGGGSRDGGSARGRATSSRGNKPGESSARGSTTSSRDASARGNRPPLSPHNHGNQRSLTQSKPLSPIHTGTGEPRPRKKQHFPTLTLEMGESYELTVVYVESLQNFYVQLNEHEEMLTALMEEVDTYCSSDEARMPDNLAIGQPVLAQFTDDQAWYRASIVKRNQSVSVVMFVDYGNQDTLPDSSLVAVPPRFLSLPAQALRCSLDGVGVQVSPEAAKTAFNDLTLEQEARGVVKGILHDSLGPIYTVDLSLSDGRKPITALVEGGHISIPRSTLSNLSPSSSPALTEVKVPSFPVDAQIDVCLSFVESPASFFLQLLENFSRLEQLTREMNEIYSSMTQREEVLFSLNEGVFCAARFSEDGVWYRARIVRVGRATAKVRFVDYGNEEEVPASDLKSLRVQFATEACLAIHCHLDGFPSEIAMSPKVLERFSAFISSNKQLIAKFLKPFSSYSKSVPVQLFDTSLSESEQNVANLLKSMHLKARQPPLQNGSNKLPMAPAPSKSSTTGSRTGLPPVKPVLNQPTECTVTHVESPSELYCQTATSTPLAEALLGELYDFYVEQSSGTKLARLEIGTVCAAPFTDGSWYRVRVEAVKSGEVAVQYIDYGNRADVTVSDLRELDPTFSSHPPHAMRCSLNGIRPIGSRGSEWTSDCRAALTTAVLDQVAMVTVVGVTSGTCDVELTVAGSDVSQSLVRDGFAIASTQQPQPGATSYEKERDYLAIPPFAATEGSEIKVFVTFCDFPNVLYCQPAQLEENFHSLTQEIQTHCNSPSAAVVTIDDVIIDDVIFAQYSEDEAWYRAQVKELGEDSLRVLFVDYGNCEETKSLRSISAEFCSLPAQAAPCTILNWREFAVRSEGAEVFNDHLTSEDVGFRLRFVEVGMTGEKSVVQLTRLSDGVGVLEHACKAGLLLTRIGPSVREGVGVIAMATNLPPVAVETNSREDGFVSHHESPSSFWIQLACNESELDFLTEGIAAAYGNAGNLAKLALSDPIPGQVCCAQFSVDTLWYRSIVETVSSNGVRVHFVDYGNNEIVSRDKVKLLKPEFLAIPVQAVHCSLIGILPPTGTTWSDESITGFAGLLLENAVTAEFVDESPEGVWSVMLTCQGKDVATVMIKERFAVSKIQPQTQPSSEPPTKISSDHPEKICMGTESSPVTIPDLELRLGESYEVYLSHLSDSPSEFYCQLMNNEETVEELMASVSDFYSANSPPPLLEVGRYCVAKYSLNNAWHRAKIVAIDGSGGEESVKVQFVDYGSCEVVPVSHVLGLSPALAALARQAVCCSLLPDPSLQLPDECIARFFQIDIELCYRILVTGCLDDGRFLVELSDFNGTVLNDHILSSISESPPLPSDPSALSFKSLSFPVSSSVDVYVSFVDSPSTFYCQPLKLADDLENMMQELADAVAGGDLEGLESVHPGTDYLAQFSVDNEWYRARVESVLGNGTEAVVHFVDYGNSECVLLSALLKCPPRLFKVPVQALHCSVFDSSTTAGLEWSEDKIEEFRNLLGEEPLSLTVKRCEVNGGLCVCSLSSNGTPIDFSPLLSSLATTQEKVQGTEEIESSCPPVAPGDEGVIEGLPSEPPYVSSASSSSLPAAAVTVTTSEGKTSEHSAGTSDDGRGVASGRGLLPDGSLEPSAGSHMNFSTLALKGSSHASAEEGLSDTESSEEASDHGDGEGEPLIKAPFTLSLSVPEEFEAMVVYVESPSFLFLQRLDCQAELEKLSLEMEQYCASFAEKQHQEIFQEGDFVLAQYADQVWYRAKVIETGTDAGFLVFFIDFGNSETITPDKMVMCPENYLELPCQAIACSLANVPRRDSWPEEYKNLIDEKVSERVVRVKVVHPAAKGMRPTVNIEDRETGTDVAQTVLNYLQDECEQGNLSNYVIPEEPEEEDSPNSDPVTPKVDTAATHEPTPQSVEVGTASSQDTSLSVPQRKLEISSAHDVYVVSCESPHSFFVQLASEGESLEEMAAAMESAYESVDTSDLTLPGPPAVGDCVCSQFSEDSKWYRAKVLGIDTKDPQKVELLFIDYGNRETGDVASLRGLSPSLPSHPPLALECFLAGVEPVEGQCSFSSEACDHLLEATAHGESVCKVEVQFTDSAGHYGVNLICGDGVNVAQSLFDAHLATALQDTPTTAASTDEATPDQLEPVTSGSPPTGEPELPLSAEEPLAVKDFPEKATKEENESDRFATSYPTPSLNPGSTHSAIVTSITSLDGFDCQLTDEIEKLEELMEQIATRGYQVGDSVLAVTQPRKGLAVCSCYTEEDVWYRAEITNVSHSRGKVQVVYVDHGNSEEVALERVKVMEKEFAEALSPLVVHCSLAPLTDRDLDPLRPLSQGAWDLVWPGECVSHFQEMMGEEGEVRLMVVGSEEEGGSEAGEGGEGLRVRVFVSGEGGEEVDVREAIIKRIADSQKSGREILRVFSEDADCGYGDSVTEEGGEGEGNGKAAHTSSGSSLKPERSGAQRVEIDSTKEPSGEDGGGSTDFEQKLEKAVKKVAGEAIAEARQDLKVFSEEETPSISRED